MGVYWVCYQYYDKRRYERSMQKMCASKVRVKEILEEISKKELASKPIIRYAENTDISESKIIKWEV